MPIAARIADFLKENRSKAICDACLAGKIAQAEHEVAREIEAALALTREFTRKTGVCDECGAGVKPVTAAK